MARLALFALISYVPFIYYFEAQLPNADNFLNFNVIYTIQLGFLALRIRNEVRRPFLKIVLMAVIFFFSAFGDWGFQGILMILIFDQFYGDYRNQCFTYLILLLTQFIPIVLNPVFSIRYGTVPDFSIYWFAVAQAGGFIPIFCSGITMGSLGEEDEYIMLNYFYHYIGGNYTLMIPLL